MIAVVTLFVNGAEAVVRATAYLNLCLKALALTSAPMALALTTSLYIGNVSCYTGIVRAAPSIRAARAYNSSNFISELELLEIFLKNIYSYATFYTRLLSNCSGQ